jgi:putative component of membrane protein insertase Oxa1/YidC/SpoIIIJ protein YidD
LWWVVLGLALAWLLSKPLALLAISGYQQFISPHKGWHCAYAALHRGASCSAYGKEAISRHGVIAGASLLWERFDQCRAAAVVLAASSSGQGCDCCGVYGAMDLAEKAAKEAAKKAVDDAAEAAKKRLDNIGAPTLAFPLPGTFEERKKNRENKGLYRFGSDWKTTGKPRSDGRWNIHVGVDWPAELNEQVSVAAPGIIRAVGLVSKTKPNWGQKIVIEHEDLGLTTAYYHVMPAEGIVLGAHVMAGQKIATIVDIGDPNVPNHLHFEVRQGTCEITRHIYGYIAPDEFPERFLDPEKDVQYAAPVNSFRGELP